MRVLNDVQCSGAGQFVELLPVCRLLAKNRSQYVIARAVRLARHVDAEVYAVHVDISGVDISGDSDAKVEESLKMNLDFAESLGAKVARLTGKSLAEATATFAREKHITQIVFGRSKVEGWRKIAYLNAIKEFLTHGPAVDIHLVTQEPD